MEPDYYQILGVEPGADQAQIEAAYRGRSLRARLRQPLPQGFSSLHDCVRAYAILSDPSARGYYDQARARRIASPRQRLPFGRIGVSAAWLCAIVAVFVLGSRTRVIDNGTAIGDIIVAGTVAEPSKNIATPPVAGWVAALARGTTIEIATLKPAALATTALTPTAMQTATPLQPTATPAPSPTPVTPTPTAAPFSPFEATDRIGAPVPVNLRSGPGTEFVPIGVVQPGTLLAATGESTYVGGFTWRHFRLVDGRDGWVRQVDVLPVT